MSKRCEDERRREGVIVGKKRLLLEREIIESKAISEIAPCSIYGLLGLDTISSIKNYSASDDPANTLFLIS